MMNSSKNEASEYIELFIRQIRTYKLPIVPTDYVEVHLSQPILDAIRKTPRHFFAEHFTIKGDNATVFHPSHPDYMKHVYSATNLLYYSNGQPLISSNSEPRFILHLLDTLNVETGQKVLEIGSGAGWLSALMSRLVGPDGKITGIELIDHLARASRKNISDIGINNIEIKTGDILKLTDIGNGYDRIIFTASVFTIPTHVFDSLKIGGILGVPIRNVGNTTEFYFLKKTGPSCAESIATRMANFVPIIGDSDGDYTGVRVLDEPTRTFLESGHFTARSMHFGTDRPMELVQQTRGFTRWMSKMLGPEFHFWDLSANAPQYSLHALLPEPSVISFGIKPPEQRGLAIWLNNEVRAYGNSEEALINLDKLLENFELWIKKGKPFGAQWRLKIEKNEKPAERHSIWTERRGDFDFRWSQ